MQRDGASWLAAYQQRLSGEHRLPGLKVARLSDVKIIEMTRTEAERMLDADPGLTQPEHRALNERVRALIDSVVDEEH